MSAWLDEHRALLALVAVDLRRHGLKETGRHGLPAESVLRCAVLKQHRQLSYQELAFHLETRRRFGHLPGCRGRAARGSRCCTRRSARSAPRRGRRSIARCSPAPGKSLERGRVVVRLDSTVTAALMHEPSDSSLLWDRPG